MARRPKWQKAGDEDDAEMTTQHVELTHTELLSATRLASRQRRESDRYDEQVMAVGGAIPMSGSGAAADTVDMTDELESLDPKKAKQRRQMRSADA